MSRQMLEDNTSNWAHAAVPLHHHHRHTKKNSIISLHQHLLYLYAITATYRRDISETKYVLEVYGQSTSVNENFIVILFIFYCAVSLHMCDL